MGSHPPVRFAEELVRFHDRPEVACTCVAHDRVHTRVLFQTLEGFFQPSTTVSRVLQQEVMPSLHLDVGDALRVSQDSATMTSLLAEAKRSELVADTELCLLVWDTLTKVGEPDYATYETWEQGLCATVDADAEQAAINAAIIAEYGSTSVL